MKKELAIIVAAADGIVSLQTGVGVVVSSFFESFGETRELLSCPVTDLYAMCPAVNAGSADFCPSTAAAVGEACRRNGGSLIQLSNITSGNSLNEIWQGTADFTPGMAWESCCSSLGREVGWLAAKYNKIYLLLHDTLFVDVPAYLQESLIRVCWIPHSLGTLFEDPHQQIRIRFEQSRITRLLARGDKVGYISHYTRDHLKLHYGVTEESLLSFYSGIYLHSKKYQSSGSPIRLQECYGIPGDKEILFTWGRCSAQKGIDIIIRAYASLQRDEPLLAAGLHLVLLCPTETAYPDYLREIRVLLLLLEKGSYTFIENFQHRLQYEILELAATRMILLCSRYESFGLTSLEALLKRNHGCSIIYSPIPTFEEVFRHTRNTKKLKETSASYLAQAIVQKLDQQEEIPAGPNEMDEIQQAFSLVKNYAAGLNQLFAS